MSNFYQMITININHQQEASNSAMYRTRKSNFELAEVATDDDLIEGAKRLS